MEAARLPAGHKPLQVLLVHRSIVQQEEAHHCCALPKQQLRKARCRLHSSHFLLTSLPALQRQENGKCSAQLLILGDVAANKLHCRGASPKVPLPLSGARCHKRSNHFAHNL